MAFLLVITCMIFHCSVIMANSLDDTINYEHMDEIVEEGMRDYHIPGLSLGLVKGDKVVYLKGYGTADNSGRLVTPQTPFILGSVSKSFTALAIMQLVEEGKINLDGRVQLYLPWLQLDDPAGAKPVTIRDLLIVIGDGEI